MVRHGGAIIGTPNRTPGGPRCTATGMNGFSGFADSVDTYIQIQIHTENKPKATIVPRLLVRKSTVGPTVLPLQTQLSLGFW
jgi:hypothetical protein